jgi:Leucine-rich repeat (LRR) protein
MYDSKSSLTLDLSGMAIQSMPLDGIETTGLTRLALSNNLLKNVPWEVTEMTALTELWLDKNHLDILPAVIGNLSGLRALNLNSNNLHSLPVSIGDLDKLQVACQRPPHACLCLRLSLECARANICECMALFVLAIPWACI